MSYNIQLRFCRALAVVRALPDRGALQPTANEKLNLYGLYKQATEGDCNTPRPSTHQMVQYAKWYAIRTLLVLPGSFLTLFIGNHGSVDED